MVAMLLFPCPVVSRNTLIEICDIVIEATSNFTLVCDFQTDSLLLSARDQRSCTVNMQED